MTIFVFTLIVLAIATPIAVVAIFLYRTLFSPNESVTGYRYNSPKNRRIR